MIEFVIHFYILICDMVTVSPNQIIIIIIITSFSCRYGQKASFTSSYVVAGNAYKPASRTRRLTKRPTAQHGGARMERDGYA